MLWVSVIVIALSLAFHYGLQQLMLECGLIYIRRRKQLTFTRLLLNMEETEIQLEGLLDKLFFFFFFFKNNKKKNKGQE